MANPLGNGFGQHDGVPGFNTIRAFVEHLQQVNLTYTVEAVGHWERNARKPSRDTLLEVLKVLVQADGINERPMLDALLTPIGYASVNDAEIEQHFPQIKPIPVHLPPLPHAHGFIGRKSTVSQLVDRLGHPNEPKVIAISGLGGIGKTALAREVALGAVRRGLFVDVLWESAKREEFIGAHIRPRKNTVYALQPILTGYARQLGIEQPASQLAMLQRQIQQRIQSRAYLLVLDNLETVDESREAAAFLNQLVANAAGSKALITSRERLTDEPYLYDHRLEGLPEAEALELLRTNAAARGAHSMLTNLKLAKQVHGVIGGMPLAIMLLVSQYLRGIALDEELKRLKRATSEEELYRFIYFDLWLRLPETAQIYLVALGTFATGALRFMMQEFTQFDDDTLAEAVGELSRMSLLEMRSSPLAHEQLYDVHPMTRWFVNSPLEAMWRQYRGQNPENPTDE